MLFSLLFNTILVISANGATTKVPDVEDESSSTVQTTTSTIMSTTIPPILTTEDNSNLWIVANISRLDNKIDGLQDKVNSMIETDLQDIKTNISSFKHEISGLKNSVIGLDKNLNSEISALGSKVTILQVVLCMFMLLGICVTIYILLKIYSKQNEARLMMQKRQSMQVGEISGNSKGSNEKNYRHTLAITSELKAKPPRLTSVKQKTKSSENITVKLSDIKESAEGEKLVDVHDNNEFIQNSSESTQGTVEDQSSETTLSCDEKLRKIVEAEAAEDQSSEKNYTESQEHEKSSEEKVDAANDESSDEPIVEVPSPTTEENSGGE